jgi:hypothetical protein
MGGDATMATELRTASIQEIHLELIRRATFNHLNGPKVVEDLEKHRDLWQAALIDRPSGVDIKLRDLPENHWNVDTLFILSSGKDDDKLELLAKSWRPDEVNWIEGKRILSVWWD